jgi:4,5-DOPA dioxygenase extradiol
MYPKADIPALQLSIQPQLSPEHHLRVGRALEPLRHEGVLIIASGSFTHNLGVDAFAAWFDLSLRENRIDDLLNYRVLAPFATKNHPTDEHLLPLYVALGAAGENARAARLHASATYSVLRMDVYAFDDVHDRLQALLIQHDALPECVTSRTTEPARGSTSI